MCDVDIIINWVQNFFRLKASESVQFFQFDQAGNMYIFPAGSGCTGVPKLVKPGDAMIFTDDSKKREIFQSEESGVVSLSNETSQLLPQVSSGCLSAIPMSNHRKFKSPLPYEDLDKLRNKNFSPDTEKKIKWAVKMYHDWRSFRHENGFENIACDLDEKDTITYENLVFALVRFLTEVKKVDGSDFPGKTLYEILICLQFHLETIGIYWKLLRDETFSDVKYTLDNVMKMCTSQGIGIPVRKNPSFNIY